MTQRHEGQSYLPLILVALHVPFQNSGAVDGSSETEGEGHQTAGECSADGFLFSAAAINQFAATVKRGVLCIIFGRFLNRLATVLSRRIASVSATLHCSVSSSRNFDILLQFLDVEFGFFRIFTYSLYTCKRC